PKTDILFTAHDGWKASDPTNLGRSTTINSNNNGLGVGSGQPMDQNESMSFKFLDGSDGNANTHSTAPIGKEYIAVEFLVGANGSEMTGNHQVYVITYAQNGSVIHSGYM